MKYLLAFDTHYLNNTAKTVCFYFVEWTDIRPVKEIAETLKMQEPYRSGQFYKRELPCILHLLQQVDLNEVFMILIDGFVVLDDQNKPGLGGRLYNRLNGRIPVIGVAKSDFNAVQQKKKVIFRGESTRPLYITSLGIEPDTAATLVKRMAGQFRIPDLLKQLDRATKT